MVMGICGLCIANVSLIKVLVVFRLCPNVIMLVFSCPGAIVHTNAASLICADLSTSLVCVLAVGAWLLSAAHPVT
jgi:hypothetical protein